MTACRAPSDRISPMSYGTAHIGCRGGRTKLSDQRPQSPHTSWEANSSAWWRSLPGSLAKLSTKSVCLSVVGPASSIDPGCPSSSLLLISARGFLATYCNLPWGGNSEGLIVLYEGRLGALSGSASPSSARLPNRAKQVFVASVISS